MKFHIRPEDRFLNIPNYVLASVAVRLLSPRAFKVMIYVAMRCYGARGNGKIVYGNRSGCLVSNPISKKYEEVSIGLSKSTTGCGLRELERHGLLVCTKASTFDQKRLAKEYRLTWMRTEDEAATNEFLRFNGMEKK